MESVGPHLHVSSWSIMWQLVFGLNARVLPERLWASGKRVNSVKNSVQYRQNEPIQQRCVKIQIKNGPFTFAQNMNESMNIGVQHWLSDC